MRLRKGYNGFCGEAIGFESVAKHFAGLTISFESLTIRFAVEH